ncbi:MAG: isocitrate lyase/PEP mutase family protein [Lachnospiraceae bacterium]|nr:isocitrate lyase/PEP mutase family protein [Lachnospiraceae bacterium]
MASKKTLKQILDASDKCILVPCVYDCASNHAVEMCGFPISLLSGGELSLAMNGAIDYGFTGLTDLEWMVSRISQTSSIPLIADIEDGFGGPLAVYRAAKRLSKAGAAAIQLEDSADMEESTKLLPRDKYLAKVRAALDALDGTDCLLIARSNADPFNPEEMKEGCERLQEAIDIGAERGQFVIAMMVAIINYEQAAEMAKIVTGPKIFADVRAEKGEDGHYHPAVTMEQLTELGFCMCSTHYTLKAAMEGMLEHGLRNFAYQSVAYTFENAPATGIESFSASGMFDPQAYVQLENSYTGGDKEYTIVGHKVENYPNGFVRPNIKERM